MSRLFIFTILPAAALVHFACRTVSATENSLIGLGHLPGTTVSEAYGVSADGKVVVGFAHSVLGTIKEEAFRWTPETGMVGLGHLPGTESSFAKAVSSDGSTIVGYSGAFAFRWTQAEGMVSLGSLPGGNGSSALAVSADGSVIVGSALSANSQIEAYIWTQATGMVGLGVTSSGGSQPFIFSGAQGVSADGSVVVGGGGAGAFRWTSGSGLTTLNMGTAHAVSADGVVVVGDGADGTFRWTQEMGTTIIPFGTDGRGVSADGQIVVGSNPFGVFESPTSTLNQAAYSKSGGPMYSLDWPDWRLTFANGVSPDGTKIVGTGYSYQSHMVEAWIANVPEPSSAMLAINAAMLLGISGRNVFKSRHRCRVAN